MPELSFFSFYNMYFPPIAGYLSGITLSEEISLADRRALSKPR